MDGKLLDIVITHYDEPWEIVKPGIEMLANQKCVDLSKIRVILIHDGSKKFKELENYTFPFDFLEIEQAHGGVSKACNHGIDFATAEWITFYDCDDSLSSLLSMSAILKGLKQTQFKLLWHPFYITNMADATLGPYEVEEFNLVFKCSKYFNTKLLKENGIRFNEDLNFSEDSAFNKLVYLYCKDGDIGKINAPFVPYIWIRREGSATDSDIHFDRNCRDMLKANMYSSEAFIKHKHPSTVLMIGRTVTDTYTILMQTEMTKHPEIGKEIEESLFEFIKTHVEYLNKLTIEQWQYLLTISEGQAQANLTSRPDRPPFILWYPEIKDKALNKKEK